MSFSICRLIRYGLAQCCIRLQMYYLDRCTLKCNDATVLFFLVLHVIGFLDENYHILIHSLIPTTVWMTQVQKSIMKSKKITLMTCLTSSWDLIGFISASIEWLSTNLIPHILIIIPWRLDRWYNTLDHSISGRTIINSNISLSKTYTIFLSDIFEIGIIWAVLCALGWELL